VQAVFDFIRQILETIRPWQLVHPWEGGVRTRLGKRFRPIHPGVWLSIPLIDHFLIVDVKPQVVNLPNQSVETRDYKVRAVSGAVYYHIVNAEKALVEVQDIDSSLQSLALGVIADYVGTHNAEDCTVDKLKDEITRALRLEASGWGLKIRRVFITDSAPVKVLRLMVQDQPIQLL
jgi:regulator of protease activity HflC (stomatin/prohibitin superfamily)